MGAESPAFANRKESSVKTVQNAAAWLLIIAAVAILILVATSDRARIGRALNAADDPRPGAKVVPTADQLAKARESARRRRAE